MRVAVDPVDEVHSRAAASLASSPLVTMVGLIGKPPPRSWGSRAMHVDDAAGFDVVVGPGDARHRVTPDGSGTVTFAGLTGLARSLATRFGDAVVTVDRTVTAESPGDGHFALFPAPIGAVRRDTVADGVMLCPVNSKLGGVVVSDGRRSLAVVDDVLFASGVCLAAGALLGGHSGPVWDRAEQYLGVVESLGLLVAEGVSDPS